MSSPTRGGGLLTCGPPCSYLNPATENRQRPLHAWHEVVTMDQITGSEVRLAHGLSDVADPAGRHVMGLQVCLPIARASRENSSLSTRMCSDTWLLRAFRSVVARSGRPRPPTAFAAASVRRRDDDLSIAGVVHPIGRKAMPVPVRIRNAAVMQMRGDDAAAPASTRYRTSQGRCAGHAPVVRAGTAHSQSQRRR